MSGFCLNLRLVCRHLQTLSASNLQCCHVPRRTHLWRLLRLCWESFCSSNLCVGSLKKILKEGRKSELPMLSICSIGTDAELARRQEATEHPSNALASPWQALAGGTSPSSIGYCWWCARILDRVGRVCADWGGSVSTRICKRWRHKKHSKTSFIHTLKLRSFTANRIKINSSLFNHLV